jgi:hypothetical protein
MGDMKDREDFEAVNGCLRGCFTLFAVALLLFGVALMFIALLV